MFDQSIQARAIRRRRVSTRRVALCFIVGFPNVLSTQVYGYVTQGVSVQLSSAGVLSVPADASLTTSGSTFQNYTGSLTVNYKARTTPGGSASLTVIANSEFSPTGGPILSNGDLTFTCGAAGLGTSCASAQAASTSVSRTVVSVGSSACTGGGGSCSSSDPASVQLSLTPAPPVVQNGDLPHQPALRDRCRLERERQRKHMKTWTLYK